MRYLDENNRNKIGLEFILNHLDTISPYGNIKKRQISPIHKLENLEEEFTNLEFFINLLKNNKKEIEKVEVLLMRLKDITNIIKNLDTCRILDEVELFELKVNSIIFMELKNIGNSLFSKEFHLFDLKKLLEILDPEEKNIPTFHIYSKYSEKLKNIRDKKSKIEAQMFSETNSELQEILRDKRRVIVIAESCEEDLIKKEITKSLVGFTKILTSNIEIIKYIDLLIAKAKLSIKYGAVRPKISENIEFIGMFNPEILEILNKKKQRFQKLDILLKNGNTILTGANMGGKTVVLKTLTLNLMLAQMGFFVFADYAELPLLDFIQFLSDDFQDITKGLSSFGAEMIKLKEITGSLKTYKKGFIALDEFARGTNPSEGKNFVKGLSEYINKFESFSIMATHYDGVAGIETPHYQVIGLKNINFENLKRKIDLNNKDSVSLIQNHMDYSIEKIDSNLEVPKDALNIATLIGLDKELKEIIKKLY